jgi:ComF family protein
MGAPTPLAPSHAAFVPGSDEIRRNSRARRQGLGGIVAAMLAELLGLVAPPRCAVCGRSCSARAQLCERCELQLSRLRPRRSAIPAVDQAWSAASYDGAARALVSALKFGHRTALARRAARAIAAQAPPEQLTGVIVPVPPAPWRRRWRGFDAAEEIAAELAIETGLAVSRCLRRTQGRRQVGRPRVERLADLPRVRVTRDPPRRPLLVDDVLTTGATLSACAAALRQGGAEWVGALTFARSGYGTGLAGGLGGRSMGTAAEERSERANRGEGTKHGGDRRAP